MNRLGRWTRRALGREDHDIKEIREEVEAFQALSRRARADEARRFGKLSKALAKEGFLLSLKLDGESRDFSDVVVTIAKNKEGNQK